MVASFCPKVDTGHTVFLPSVSASLNKLGVGHPWSRPHPPITSITPVVGPVFVARRNFSPLLVESVGKCLDAALSPGLAPHSHHSGLFSQPGRKRLQAAPRHRSCSEIFCFSTESPKPCAEGFAFSSKAIVSS